MSLGNTALLPGAGMIVVGCAALWYWRRVSGASFRWFSIGAALWLVAVIIKFLIAILSNAVVLKAIKENSSHAAFVTAGGLFIGIESSLCEIGLTILAGLIWKAASIDTTCRPGDRDRQFRVRSVRGRSGTGWPTSPAPWPGEPVCRGPSRWERCSGSPPRPRRSSGSRAPSSALLQSSSTPPRAGSYSWAFDTPGTGMIVVIVELIFTLIDALAGGMQLSGLLGSVSLWWIELLLSSAAFLSLPSIWWLFRRFGAEPGTPEKTPANDILE